MSNLESFSPIIDARSRILILGSMPGAKSIEEQQYYANPRNQFWQIIYSLFSTPIDHDYNDRILFLRNKGIALWDVISTCTRVGSLDPKIENESVNDFSKLFEDYPNIKLVAFNGTKAFEVYKRRVSFDQTSIDYRLLPSTSPANTRKFEAKQKEWEKILDYIST